MATVRLYPTDKDRNDGTNYSLVEAQITSDGPPGTANCKWAHTSGEGARWLLLRPTLRGNSGWDSVTSWCAP